MNTVTVNASKSYNVIIGSGMLSQLGNHISAICKAQKIAVISDSNVWPLYGNIVQSNLQAEGFNTYSFVFPAGEQSKNAQTYLNIVNFLAENQFTRTDAIVALGGGVVGDITGFAAATFLRGIPFIQVPTTLLAMVDSSVGGKTAIDLSAGKNLVGAFYQPSLVLCDTDVLDTLDKQIFCDGCAEIIKYAILFDAELFEHLNNYGLNFDREIVITRCVELKRDVVSEDEFDTGIRQKLNLGHTIGHAIEKNSSFTVTHGQAVAIGTAIIAKAAHKYNLCDNSTVEHIIKLLESFSLPVQTEFSAAELSAVALSDKKRSGSLVNMIVPRKIGLCDIYPLPILNLEIFIEAGL